MTAKRKPRKASNEHHPWCKSTVSAHICNQCERLLRDYPVMEGETASAATARYFPQLAVLPEIEPEQQLIMVRPGKPVLVASEPMVEAHVKLRETLDELEIFMRQETVSLRRSRKADEYERIEEVRTVKMKTERRRVDYQILETEGHKREVKRVKTTASKMEKEGKLPRDLAKHLYAFAQRVADGMGVATEDSHDSSNRLTASYEPLATLGAFGSRTPSDRQLDGLAAMQEMKNRIPSELIPIFNQIIDEEVAGYHPWKRTLAELGEMLGYKHSQQIPAGSTLVYAVTCMIAHFMRERGFSTSESRQNDADNALVA